MPLPDMPDEPDRQALIAVVGWVMGGDFDEGEETPVWLFLDRHLSDPNWSDIIFWPSAHRIASGRGPFEPTPEEVVDIAFEHRIIPLGP